MKVLSLISTVLLALSLAGAVQAKPAAAAPQDNVAPATIVLAHCDANDTTPCSIDAPVANEADHDALPPEHQKQQLTDPATPVPEPQTCIMLMLGLVVLGFASRRNTSLDKFKE